MGDYATTTSLSMLLPFTLKGNTTTSDTVGAANYGNHITRAEGLINGYVASRYSLPFTTVPPIIRTLADDIACYYFIRSTYVQDGNRKNEYADSFKAALVQLADIRDGRTPLSATNGSLIAQTTANKFKTSTDYAPTFNEDDPEAWKGDPDKEEDIGGAR